MPYDDQAASKAPAKPPHKKHKKANGDVDEVGSDGLLKDIELVPPAGASSLRTKANKTPDVNQFFSVQFVNEQGQRKRTCKLCTCVI